MEVPASSAPIFKALGNEVRLRIVRTLARYGEVSCQKLCDLFPLSQPTMSTHFAKLVDAGIIRVRKEGTSHYYSLDTVLLRRHGISPKP